MKMLFGSYFESKRKAASKYVEEWQGLLYSGIVFGATLVVMFWASVFLYTSFYFTYMPQESVAWPIHFQYDSCGEKPGICSNPHAVVSVTDPVRGSVLARGQKYRVVVDIEMPESPPNQRLGNEPTGMFLVDVDMKSHSGELLRKSSRSAMLRYRSPLLNVIGTTLLAPFLLYGVHEEKQMVTVELFSQYEEDPVTPLSEVHVELTTRHIELYASQLRIHAMFSGLRYFMFHYPLTAAIVGIGICMVFLSAVVILSWYQFTASDDKSQMNFKPAIFPSGPVRAVTTNVAKSITLAPKHDTSISPRRSSASKTDEEEITTGMKSKDLDETAIGSTTGMKSKDLDETAKGSDFDKTSDTNQLPESERRSSDDFEVVSSTKAEGEEGDKCASEDVEADVECVVRHRVQIVLDE